MENIVYQYNYFVPYYPISIITQSIVYLPNLADVMSQVDTLNNE